jgi:hypothetical protein
MQKIRAPRRFPWATKNQPSGPALHGRFSTGFFFLCVWIGLDGSAFLGSRSRFFLGRSRCWPLGVGDP